jgi:AmmeMemoRadiSam system protein B
VRLTEIMASPAAPIIDDAIPSGSVRALVAPHIDIDVGQKAYAHAYGALQNTTPDRIVVLGTGHQLQDVLFSLSEKDFITPLGVVESDGEAVKRLKRAGGGIVAENDFIHRSEHSIEFQLIFLQHILEKKDFTLIPILCGSLQQLVAYTRDAFLERAGTFLESLKQILSDPDYDTLLVAGVDFSHTGPKFGHDQTARAMEMASREHDQNLLKHLSHMNADRFWEESARVEDRYNVCGFSALACLLEVLPECRSKLLNYEIWHETPTQSAVSFASVVFTASP